MLPSDADGAELVAQIDAVLDSFLAARTAELHSLGHDLDAITGAAHDLVLGGGKRMRPRFAYWGWRCVRHAGAPGTDAALAAAAALELLHAAALVHDDLIDGSQTRRGQPAAHVRFQAQAGDATGAADFGSAAAILLGDQLLSWAWALLAEAGPDQHATALFGMTAQEMMAGQYLDVRGQLAGEFSVESALRVARLKSGRYTVERPLQFGAALAGADAELLAALGGFGIPIGEAFQLRDDVLGVFGDPARTGKPAGDDLREGKRTVLVALAYQASSGADRDVLTAGLGDPGLDAAGVDQLRAIITGSGAVAEVETMIAARVGDAHQALEAAVLRPDARSALQDLARQATDRQA